MFPRDDQSTGPARGFAEGGIELTVDWGKLGRRHLVSRCAYHWVDDASIADALRSGDSDDLQVPHCAGTHRALRVATVARLLQEGANFPPLTLHVVGRKIHVKDGHHRLRARMFLGMLTHVPVVVHGDVRGIQHARS